MNLFQLPPMEIFYYVIVGIVLGLLYLILLWKTVYLLPKIQHKAIFLLGSALLRIALLVGTAWLISFQDAIRFLWIIISVVVTRFIVLSIVKSGGKR